MKKRMTALLLALLLILTLAGCGKGKESTETQSLTVPGVGTDGGWIGRGGCFRVEPAEEEDGTRHFTYQGHEYRFYDSWEGRSLTRDGETVFETLDMVNGVSPTEKGIWIGEELRDGNDWFAHFVLLDGEGAEQYVLHFPLPGGSYPRIFSAVDERLYLNCSDALRIYSDRGEELADISHAEWEGQLLRGSDGELYYVEEGDLGGGSVFAVDVEGAAFRPLFDYAQGQLCRGDDVAPFLLIKSEGIDRLQRDGAASPLVIWEECGLSLSGLLNVQARDDGSYLLTGFANPLRMVAAEPSELKARVKLTLGVLPMNTEGTQIDFAMANANLVREVSAFNAWSTDSYVQLVDLSEGGTLNAEQAQLKLNTKLLSGECPDMLLFNNWSLSPFPYLRKGLLREMGAEFLQSDPDMSEEDIVIAPMLRNDLGGLYLLGSRWSVETRYGLQERFGKVWGWDYDTYRQIDREAPEGSMVMYNLTRDYFLQESASRFLRTAINWQSGTCDFDNEDFIKLLTACRDMRETPEDPNNMVFGTPAQLMESGYMITGLAMLTSPEEYARQLREQPWPISFIGFPTPDGSCGTDLEFGDAVGILSGSAHPEACWEFMKFRLTQPGSYGFPAYRPALEEKIREARRDKSGEESDPFAKLDRPMTDTEVQSLYELLAHIEHTSLYDSAALDIIREEFTPVLVGDKSPEEAARLVQSRISLYVSEQS